MKLSPILEYGIVIISKYLSTTHMNKLNTGLSRFLKHICRVSKCTKNRIIHLICDTSTYTNFVKQKNGLSVTDEYAEYTREILQKMNDVDEELFYTPVMTQQMWKDCMQTNRHIVTRHAAHGFHRHIYTRQTLHYANKQCTWRLCGQQYHTLKRANNTLSLTQHANNLY